MHAMTAGNITVGYVGLVPNPGYLYRITETAIEFLSGPHYDKSSDFLRYAASCINDGVKPDRTLAPAGWSDWVSLTLPEIYEWDEPAVVETRVLRFLLAADIAESEGH